MFQYFVQEEMKDVIQESRGWGFLLHRNKINPELLFLYIEKLTSQ